MAELFGSIWQGVPKRVVNTNESGDHVWGNQVFSGAEIIAHRTCGPMMQAATPREFQALLGGFDGLLSRLMLKATRRAY